ncbi:MAG: ATP-binding protein [bacterium]
MSDRPRAPKQQLPLVGGLFRRLFLHHLVLVTVPIVILGLLLVRIAENSIRQTQAEDNQEITLRAQGQILDYLKFVEGQHYLTALSIENLIGPGEEGPRFNTLAIDNFLNQAAMDPDATIFSDLYALGPDMELVATTDFTIQDASGLGARVTEAARTALGGVPRTLPVLIEGTSRLPTVVKALPLTVRQEVAGALVVKVNIHEMWDLIDRIEVGERGRAFLVNQEGVLIAHEDKSLVYGQADYSHLESVSAALSREEPGQVDTEQAGEESEPMMAAYAPIRDAGLVWGLIIHRPLAEVQAVVGRMRLQILTVIFIGIALALISTLVYTRRLIRPIGTLVDGANRLSQGDLSYKIPVAGRDELGTLAAEFNLMAERLSRIQERLRRAEHLDTLAKFSSVVAHEIRNPLNAMQINLHLLEERLDEEDQEYLDVIGGEIRRLENLVREFQDISRPPALSLQSTDVNELLSDLVNLQRGTADKQDVEVKKDFDRQLPRIQVDRNRITQAVLNLVLNAFQSMPEGGELTLRTRPREDGRPGISIQVSDTGEGIPEEKVSKVFDFYYTSRDSGSGLGLSIAQQIVDEHGGQITLDSEIGEGTTITIRLPARPPEDGPPAHAADR